MKKIMYLLLVLALSALAACSSNDASNTEKDSEASGNQTEETKKENSDDESVKVDKGLLNVEITLPASMFEGEDMDETIKNAKEKGIKEVTQNDDGSVTYKMSKSVHKEIMKEMKTTIEQSVEETKNSEDYTSIKDITYNDSFTEFTMVVDKEAYENSMDGFGALSLGMSGMFYQLYDGASPDEYDVTISLEDEASGEVFDEIVYPDALEEE